MSILSWVYSLFITVISFVVFKSHFLIMRIFLNQLWISTLVFAIINFNIIPVNFLRWLNSVFSPMSPVWQFLLALNILYFLKVFLCCLLIWIHCIIKVTFVLCVFIRSCTFLRPFNYFILYVHWREKMIMIWFFIF